MDNDIITKAALSLTKEVYNDVAHPTLTQLGKLIALPLSFLGYPADLLLEKYKDAMKKAINKVPEEKQIPPKASIVAPLLEHLKYTFDESELLDAFTNLLASCIDSDYSDTIHVSFIDKIKQLSVYDLMVLKFINKNFMFCFCDLSVWFLVKGDKSPIENYDLFTNIKSFAEDSQQVRKSLDLLISLGLVSVEFKEQLSYEEYAKKQIAFFDNYMDPEPIELFTDYCELCEREFGDEEYDGEIYKLDKFFFSIELSPELEKMLRQGREDKEITIEKITSTRRNIRLTSYGKHFLKCIDRQETALKDAE